MKRIFAFLDLIYIAILLDRLNIINRRVEKVRKSEKTDHLETL